MWKAPDPPVANLRKSASPRDSTMWEHRNKQLLPSGGGRSAFLVPCVNSYFSRRGSFPSDTWGELGRFPRWPQHWGVTSSPGMYMIRAGLRGRFTWEAGEVGCTEAPPSSLEMRWVPVCRCRRGFVGWHYRRRTRLLSPPSTLPCASLPPGCFRVLAFWVFSAHLTLKGQGGGACESSVY